MTVYKTGLVAAALAVASLGFTAPASAHDRGGDGAAIAIGAGVIGLAIGAAIASDDDDRGYYRGDYQGGYYGGYNGGGYNGGGYYNRGYYPAYPQYRGYAYPQYRSYGYPAYRGDGGYGGHEYRERREHERWEHRGGWRGR